MAPNKIQALLLACATRCLVAMGELAKGVLPKDVIVEQLEVARTMLDSAIEGLKK